MAKTSVLGNISGSDTIELCRLTQGPLPKAERVSPATSTNIGLVDGIVLHGLPDGFALQVMANPERRFRFEARLAWLRSAEARNDQRKAARIVPVHRAVQIRLEETEAGRSDCRDLSMTGAALLLVERPRVGALVTVGKRYANGCAPYRGIGVAFRMPFGPLTFNEHVIL